MLSINFKFVLPVLLTATVVKEATATTLLKPIKVCDLSGFTVAVDEPCTCLRSTIPFILGVKLISTTSDGLTLNADVVFGALSRHQRDALPHHRHQRDVVH